MHFNRAFFHLRYSLRQHPEFAHLSLSSCSPFKIQRSRTPHFSLNYILSPRSINTMTTPQEFISYVDANAENYIERLAKWVVIPRFVQLYLPLPRMWRHPPNHLNTFIS